MKANKIILWVSLVALPVMAGLFYLTAFEHRGPLAGETPEGTLPETPSANPSGNIPEFEHSYLIKPDSLQHIRKFDSAIYYYRKAAGKFREEENWEGYVRSLNQQASCYNLSRQYDSAYVVLMKSLHLGKEKLGERHPEIANAYFYMGQYFDFNNAPEKAIKYHTRALDRRKMLYGKQSKYVANSYEGLGDVYLFVLRDYLHAESFYKKALTIREKPENGTQADLVRTHYTLASINRQRGDFKNALLFASRALDLARGLPGDKAYYLSLCFNILANIHNQLEEFDEAIAYYQKAIQLTLKSESDQYFLLENYYNNLGSIYLAKEAYSDTYKYFRKALTINEINYGPGSQKVASSYYQLGWYFTATENFDSARYYYRQCLTIRKQDPDNYAAMAELYEDLGKMYEDCDSIDTALLYYQKALNTLITDFDTENIYRTPDITPESYSPELFEIVIYKANALRMRYNQSENLKDLKTALALYEVADQMNDFLRNSYSHEASKLFLEEYYKADFEKGIKVAFMLYEQLKERKYLELAYKFIEKSKYILLFESLNKAEKFNEVGVPENIREQENNLVVKKNYYQLQINREEQNEVPDENKIQSLRQKEFAVSRNLEKLKTRLVREFPQYYRIKYDSFAVTSRDVRRLLQKEDATLVEYYWGDSTIYAICIDPLSVNLYKINKPDSLEDIMESYLSILTSTPRYKVDDFHQYQEQAYELYRILVAPLLADRPYQGQKKRKLIFIPDGPMAYLPFEALITRLSPSGEIDYKNLDYLIKDYQISYAYSANLLVKNKNSRKNKGAGDLVAFGFSADREDKNLGVALPGSAKELQAISSVIEGKYYTGKEATEQNFKHEARQYDILHLAIHGIADLKNPLNTRLVFRKGDEREEEDGVLYFYELYNLNLRSQLVVLSACETGRGRQYEGEGIYSMARGFAYAGCPSIVMSFWKISDRTTATLMGTFYRQLAAGSPIDHALGQAKLAYLKQADEYSAHPANWAAFVSLGDVSPIPVNTNHNPLTVPAVILTCITVFVAIQNRKKLLQFIKQGN